MGLSVEASMNAGTKPILVIGGGIAGMTAAVEAAEVGYRVVLVEKEAYLGGRVMGMHRYFPKMCPPACGFEINVRRIRQNSRIAVHTLATVEEILGNAGDFKARIRIRPRYVTGQDSLDSEETKKMTQKTEQQKLAIRLDHWIEHNTAHTHEFQQGAEKANDLGHHEVHDEILLAAEKLNEASEHLHKASEKLGNAQTGFKTTDEHWLYR